MYVRACILADSISFNQTRIDRICCSPEQPRVVRGRALWRFVHCAYWPVTTARAAAPWWTTRQSITREAWLFTTWRRKSGDDKRKGESWQRFTCTPRREKEYNTRSKMDSSREALFRAGQTEKILFCRGEMQRRWCQSLLLTHPQAFLGECKILPVHAVFVHLCERAVRARMCIEVVKALTV